MKTVRADVVGSLLRPSYLREAQDRRALGELAEDDFRAIEDRAVEEALALQEAAGLDAVTDGEMRRRSFQAPMTDAVEGFGVVPLEAFLWGRWHGEGGVKVVSRPERLGLVGRLVRRRSLVAHEFAFLRDRTRRTPKVSIPSAGLWSNLWSRDVYPELDAYYADLVSILRSEVRELLDLGAPYIQIDAPHYALLLDPEMRAFYELRGGSLDRWIELDNAVVEGFTGATFGIHF